MLAAYASVALLCAASIVIGQAILSICGREQFSWLSAPVGLAAILVVSGIAVKLPGHVTAVVIAEGFLLAACIARLVRGRGAAGFTAELGTGIPAALVALLIASVPFIVNGRVGILGVGLVNDDMAYHLLIADWLTTRVGDMPVLLHQGYPVGPHALAAGIDKAFNTGLVRAFAAITLIAPVQTAMVASDALWPLRRLPRIVAAGLVAIPYLAAAYVAQGAFKEPIEALFLLSFALLLPTARSPLRAVPLGVIAAGAVYTYSFPGLFWLAGAAGAWALVELVRRRRLSAAALLGGGVAIAALLVLSAPEWSRMVDFSHFRAFRNSALSSGLGNVRHQLSPLEALGIWPASDFRLSAADASVPAAAFYAGAVIALAALAIGLPRWLRTHGTAIPSALAAAAVIYLGARLFGTVYTSAKALSIAAPLVTLISFGGLLDGGGAVMRFRGAGLGPATFSGMSATSRRRDIPRGRRGAARLLLAAALALGLVGSSLVVLRQAPVAPQDHATQLAKLRPLVQGHDVLFLGRDNFISYELRGARPFTAVRNFYDPNYVKPDLRLADIFQKFDFDSVTPATLGRFRYVITTRAAYASGPSPGFSPVAATPTFQLWKRTAPVGPRRTLAEGASPGALLHCATPKGRRLERSGGVAYIFPRAPVAGGTWTPSSTVESGSPVRQTLTAPAGTWEVSLQYDATRAVNISAPGYAFALPANLDYRGSVPFYPAGRVAVPKPGPVTFTVSVEEPPLLGRLVGTKSEAHLGAIALSPVGQTKPPNPGESERRRPLDRACKRYVDWYRPAGHS